MGVASERRRRCFGNSAAAGRPEARLYSGNVIEYLEGVEDRCAGKRNPASDR